MAKKTLQICTALNNDGTRCGRRAPEGSLICHIHKAKAEGTSISPMSAPSPFDPKSKLLKIAAKDGHPHQMQAIKILLNRDGDGEEGCRECADRKKNDQATNDEYDATLRAMTDDEYQRHRALTEQWIAAYNQCKAFRIACAQRIAQKGKAQ